MSRHLEIVNKQWKGDSKQNNLLPIRVGKLKVSVSCLKDTGHKAIKNSWSSPLFLLCSCFCLPHLYQHTLTFSLSTHFTWAYLYTTFLCAILFLASYILKVCLQNPNFLRNSCAQSFYSLLYFLTEDLNQFTNISGHLLTCTSCRLRISTVK